jgi:putative peptidoglycan lipid II flippase
LILAAPWWVPVTVAGFSEVGKAEAVQLTQVMIGGIMFTGLIAVQQAAAYARGSYVWPDLAQALSNLIALGMLVVMLPKYGVVAAAWITLGRVGLQCLLTMNELGKWIRPDRNDPALKTSWRRMRPLILGASYYKMDPLIDRFLLSGLAPGSLSLFALAQQLHGAGSQIVTRAIGTPAQTKMAVAFKREDNASVGSTLRSGFWAATAFCAVCIIVLALVGQPILTLLFGQGEFASGQVKQLWLVLLLSSAVFILGASSSILAGAFYVRGDTRSPTLLGSASFTLSIVLKIVMYRQFGIYGLALAVSFQYVLSACLLAGRLQRLGVVSWLSWDRSH